MVQPPQRSVAVGVGHPQRGRGLNLVFESAHRTADVPEGGGIIVKETVLTQPRPGEFKGFVARCTHSGCLLAEVKNGSIVCACHGSRFDLNGQVTRGPATAPLTVRAVTVREGEIVAE
ncbi:MAG: Rieske (2Fe-2S) protein [Mycobacteriaceae bacterium]|nr:Rieske (2Fe-2S) protein [Mycobacteriaceae bacterium]